MRVTTIVTIALLTTCSCSWHPSRPAGTEETGLDSSASTTLTDFESIVLKEVRRTIPREDLTDNSLAYDKPFFAFYGTASSRPTIIPCGVGVALNTAPGGTDPIMVAVCPLGGPLDRKTLPAATVSGFDAIKAEATKVGVKVGEVGPYQRKTLPDGSEAHFFNVLFIGDGCLLADSAVVFPKEGQYVLTIQFLNEGHFCARHPRSRLCSDPLGVFQDLAPRLAGRLIKRGSVSPQFLPPTPSDDAGNSPTAARTPEQSDHPVEVAPGGRP